jgi:hypothetical protein
MDFKRYAPEPNVETNANPTLKTAFSLLKVAFVILFRTIWIKAYVFTMKSRSKSLYISLAVGGFGWGMAALFGTIAILSWWK